MVSAFDSGKPAGVVVLVMVLALVVSLTASMGAWAAEVVASIDRDRVTEGETVTLVLETDDPQQSLEADLAGLENDFQVIDQRSETRMSITNGRQTAVVRLMITLEPRRSGALTIPALSFRGGSRTRPLSLNVDPAPELAPGELPAVFIEVEIDPADGPHYVHAQLSLKVRIFYQQNLTEASISPPEPSQASVRLLDEVPYQADRNGQQYRVLERRYAVFPERSGSLTIPAMQLTGRLIERPADRLWQPTIRGRRVRIESDPLILDIQPRPASFAGDNWLPARSVTLSQQITDGESVTVGEPVTRTIILEAVGLEEHMLEEPTWPPMEAARIYPDQPQGISRDDGQWVLGAREFRYAVVPEDPGTLVLPEVRLTWWDTVNDRQQVAVLAEHRIDVLPSSLGTQSPPAAVDAGVEVPGASPGDGGGEVWPWQALSALFGALWLGTLAMLIRRPRAEAATNGGRTRGRDEDERQALKALGSACKANDARAAHLALARWLRRFGPKSGDGSLMGWSRSVGDPALSAAIRELDAMAYGSSDEAGEWRGDALWSAFERWRRARAKGAGKKNGEEGAGSDSLDLYAAVR